MKFWRRAGFAAFVSGCLVAACSSVPEIAPAERPLSKEAQALLAKKGMNQSAPIYVRIFKEESELEVWKARDDGRYYHFKTYPICNWSGDIGPKLKQGDKQAPEGFYTVANHQLNPNSQFYLAFNLGYPNAFDRAHKRDGNFLMVHGNCKSAGCYAMTDALMEEIYALARDSLRGGQQTIPVHAFPFRMTPEKLALHKGHKWHGFWSTLKEGYDHFEMTRQPPTVAVCERKYVVNVKLPSGRIDPETACPHLERVKPEPFSPRPQDQIADAERVTVPGPKMRSLASAGGSSPMLFGLGLGSSQRQKDTPASGPMLGFQQ